MSKILMVLAIVVGLSLGGCSTVKTGDAQNNADTASTIKSAVKTGNGDTSSVPSTGTDANALKRNPEDAGKLTIKTDPLDDPNSKLSKRAVYFDYDSSAIKSEYNDLIAAHGQYLRDHPGQKVVIQGNTDERGGSEYNLALGQRRAESVKQRLAISGAKENQLEAISFGKEKPKASGNNEASWAENRRVDLAY